MILEVQDEKNSLGSYLFGKIGDGVYLSCKLRILLDFHDICEHSTHHTHTWKINDFTAESAAETCLINPGACFVEVSKALQARITPHKLEQHIERR